jgi:ParB family chromosome partitioning protein
MSSKRHGLGKGLGALIPSTEPRTGLTEANVNEIAVNPRQPRMEIDAQSLRELADSVREHGVLQPLIVAESTPQQAAGSRFTIIAGERRWRAAMLAGLQTVPVLVKEATPQETLELALVENIQRADLNALEEANAYQQLVDEFGLTQEEVAERVGRSRVAVTNSLRLLRLPEAIRTALLRDRISGGHARALLGLPDESLQLRALRVVQKQGLSVRQTEELVRRYLAEGEKKRTPGSTHSPETRALEDRFRSSLGTKVNLHRSKRGGRLVIYFFSEEELQSLFDRIVGEAESRHVAGEEL